MLIWSTNMWSEYNVSSSNKEQIDEAFNNKFCIADLSKDDLKGIFERLLNGFLLSFVTNKEIKIRIEKDN